MGRAVLILLCIGGGAWLWSWGTSTEGTWRLDREATLERRLKALQGELGPPRDFGDGALQSIVFSGASQTIEATTCTLRLGDDGTFRLDEETPLAGHCELVGTWSEEPEGSGRGRLLVKGKTVCEFRRDGMTLEMMPPGNPELVFYVMRRW